MKCPHCGKEIADGAKFCKFCGQGVEIKPAEPEQGGIMCAVCGATLKPGAKFCPKCGQKVNVKTASGIIQQEEENVCPNCKAALKPGAKFCAKCGFQLNTDDDPKTKKEKKTCPKCGMPLDIDATFCPNCGPLDSEEESGIGTKNGNTPLIIGIIALIVALVLLGFVLWKTGILKFGSDSKTDPTPEPVVTEEPGESPEGNLDNELSDLIEDVDQKVKQANDRIDENNFEEGRDGIKSAIDEYKRIADDNDAHDKVEPKIIEAFDVYSLAVEDIVKDTENEFVDAEKYETTENILYEAIGYGEQLQDDGYDVDTEHLRTLSETYQLKCKERYIYAINDICSVGSGWKEKIGEACDLMEKAKDAGLVDIDAEDDPLTMRYKFVLSWKLALNLLDEYNSLGNDDARRRAYAREAYNTLLDNWAYYDYTPAFLDYMDTYALDAGLKTSVIEKLKTEIGKLISQGDKGFKEKFWDDGGKSIRYWYFNDFGEYSNSDTCGCTPETKREIMAIAKSYEYEL